MHKANLQTSAKKFLKSMKKKSLKKYNSIRNRIKSIEQEPYKNTIKLKGKNFYRHKFEDIRFIFTIDNDKQMIEIQKIGYRKDVYKNLLILFTI